MKQLRRVVWTEGMYLAPQHFQTQGRYLEDSLAFAVSSLWFRPYGLLAWTIDLEALQNGTAALLEARGVMPDGLAFHLPESDEPPVSRPIAAAFSPTSDSQILYLALPERREGLPNVTDAGGPSAIRYVSGTQLRCDETSGAEERLVSVGRKNFRLLNLLRGLLGIMEEKSHEMGGRQRGSGQAAGDYWRRDLTSFWFLHTIHSSIAQLRHLLLSKHGHPEELFRELSRLGGALCSFSLHAHPRDLPLYNHDALGECFAALETHILRHLEMIVPTNVVEVAFHAAESYFFTATITDPRLLDRSRWLFEIQSKAGEAALISRTPQLVKLCSERFIREVVRRAVPGLTLTHLPTPPPAVPAKVEAQYFGVSKSGPCWDHIMASRQVGLYVPGDFPAPQVSLIILTEDEAGS